MNKIFFIVVTYFTACAAHSQNNILFDINERMVIFDVGVTSTGQILQTDEYDRYNKLLVISKCSDTTLKIRFKRSVYDEIYHSEDTDMKHVYKLQNPFKINIMMYFPDLKEEKSCTITCDSYVRDLVVVPTGITDDKKYKVTIFDADEGLAVVTNNEDYVDSTNNDNHSDERNCNKYSTDTTNNNNHLNKECCIA